MIDQIVFTSLDLYYIRSQELPQCQLSDENVGHSYLIRFSFA